jgi:tetratricopeptide (TPR) repeat protein
MRRLFLAALLALASPAAAEIASTADCAAAIRANPATAREDAALWARTGGGVEARVCEAAALEALGAYATAARLLMALAENPNRAINTPGRAVLFEDAARLWLDAGQAALARAALASADRLTLAPPRRLMLRARAEAASDDWSAARATLDAVLAAEPDSAMALSLRAATARRLGDPEAALADAERARALQPAMPEAIFETAAALAEAGRTDEAADLWLDLIRISPDNPLADAARRNLQTLNEAAPEPIAPRPAPQDQGPRPKPRRME